MSMVLSNLLPILVSGLSPTHGIIHLTVGIDGLGLGLTDGFEPGRLHTKDLIASHGLPLDRLRSLAFHNLDRLLNKVGPLTAQELESGVYLIPSPPSIPHCCWTVAMMHRDTLRRAVLTADIIGFSVLTAAPRNDVWLLGDSLEGMRRWSSRFGDAGIGGELPGGVMVCDIGKSLTLRDLDQGQPPDGHSHPAHRLH